MCVFLLHVRYNCPGCGQKHRHVGNVVPKSFRYVRVRSDIPPNMDCMPTRMGVMSWPPHAGYIVLVRQRHVDHLQCEDGRCVGMSGYEYRRLRVWLVTSMGLWEEMRCIFVIKNICLISLQCNGRHAHAFARHARSCDLGRMWPMSAEARVHVIQMERATQLLHPGAR